MITIRTRVLKKVCDLEGVEDGVPAKIQIEAYFHAPGEVRVRNDPRQPKLAQKYLGEPKQKDVRDIHLNGDIIELDHEMRKLNGVDTVILPYISLKQ